MTDDEKGRLISKHAILVGELANPGLQKLLDVCLEYALLTDYEYKNLLESRRTNADRARYLLCMVWNARREHAFDVLCKALKEAGFADIASLLSPSSTTTESGQILLWDNSYVSC